MPTAHRPLSNESARLPLWLPVCVALGIALYFGQNAPTPWWWMTLFAASCALILAAFRQIQWVKLSAIALLAVALGGLASALRMEVVEAPVLQEAIFFKPVTGIVSDIQKQEKKTKIYLKDVSVEGLEAAQTPKRVSISFKILETKLAIGDTITVPAMLFPPPSPAMPDAYDFGRMFYFEQLGAVGFSPRQPTVISRMEANGFLGKLTALRLSIANHLVANMGAEEGPVAAALMVGEQAGVSDAVSEAMRAAGTYHVLSISGLHMTLACGIVFYIIRLALAMIPHAALRWPIKKIAAIGGLLGGFGYLLLAGYPVPAIRSYVMVACVLVAVLCDRRGISLYSLAWAATLVLLFTPESLFMASFQLSFAATIGIVALYERFGHVFFHANKPFIQRVPLYFLGLMLTSLAATFYTTPLSLYHFNSMAVWGVFANMLVVPLSSFLIMPAALLTFVTMPFGWDAPFLWALNLSIHWMIENAYFMESLPYSNITLPSPSFIGMCLVVMAGLWLSLWATWIRYLGVPFVIIGLSSIALHVPYDILINEQAKRIAYRTEDNRLVFLRGEAEGFEPELWLRAQGKTSSLSLKEAQNSVPELACESDVCRLTRAGKQVEILLRKSGNDKLCAGSPDIIITDKILTDRCWHVPHVVDGNFMKTHGATAIRFAKNGDVEVESAHDKRGTWPWSGGF